MNIWILAILIGIILMIIVFVILMLLDRKSGNIDYLILQTFLGGQKPIITTGKVDVANDGSFMAEHIVRIGKHRQNIGTFHQKFLLPARGNRYFMMLEEYDVNRFRPLVYDHSKQETPNLRMVPNDDVDFVLHRKEKNRQLILRKQEQRKWLPYIAGAAVFLFLFLGTVVNGYYNYETSKVQLEISKNYNPGRTTETILNAFVEKMTNETVREAFKVVPSGKEAPPPS